MRFLELKIPPLLLVLITGALMWLITRGFPNADFAFPAALLGALMLSAIGAGIAVLGVLEFRAARTTVDPRVPHQSASLVVSGVYRYSRNPMYLGFFLVLCSWAVVLGNAPALVLLPAFVLYMNRFQIAPEERHMEQKFGESFRHYCRVVRRWI